MPPFIRNLIERFGAGRTLTLALVGVGTVVVIWAFAYWAGRPEWVPLFPGMELETVAEVTARLDESKIPYRLARGGSEVQVTTKELPRARVLLAQAGVPRKGRPGFELFDQPSWGMTDFTQRINYRRALEGELERTIGQMRGIESAQVHLALHETTVFRRNDRTSEASVFLRLRSGVRPGAEMVEAITFLVAGSVDGLKSENVTVLDDNGRVLSAALETGPGSGLTKRQLGLQREVESYLETRAEELVAEVVGAGNVRVRVSAALNFDQVDRTVQAVDPDQQVAMREERSRIIPGPTTPGAASTIENTSYEVTRSIERFIGGQGDVRRLTVAVLVNDRLVGSGESAQHQPRGANELRQVELLVKNAVGIDSSRGDEISVVSVAFDPRPTIAPERGPSIFVIAETLQRPIVGVVGVVLAFLLALQILRTVRRPEPEPEPEPIPLLAAEGEPELLEEPEAQALPAVSQKVLAQLELDGRAQIRDTIEARPDSAVRVIRAWLRES